MRGPRRNPRADYVFPRRLRLLDYAMGFPFDRFRVGQSISRNLNYKQQPGTGSII